MLWTKSPHGAQFAQSLVEHRKVPMTELDPPAAPQPPAPPESTVAFAARARDLAALRDSVVDAASVGAGLWFSYLFVLFYLAIAAGSVTHRDLFYESPLKLPFLNVDLQMIGFFVLAPLLFVIVHSYVLLHIGFFARKVQAFHAELRAQIAEDDTRARLRLQLPSNIFVQFLAGPSEVRTGTTGVLLRAIAWISLVMGPVALLVFFVLQFLPHHSESVSWWQRLLVAADLALLWRLWPQIVRTDGPSPSSGKAISAGRLVAAGASAVALLLVFAVATFPGEWLHTHLPEVRFIPTKLPGMDGLRRGQHVPTPLSSSGGQRYTNSWLAAMLIWSHGLRRAFSQTV
jgi:hypothetical protein